MNRPAHLLLTWFLLLAWSISQPASAGDPADRTPWHIVEFEEKAFWATARSRIELLDPASADGQWELRVSSSVPGNSEDVVLRFDPADGRVLERERLSQGKEDQRLKRFEYGEDRIVRERRAPDSESAVSPGEWPATSRQTLTYPPAADELIVTNPYLLIILAQRLQAEQAGSAMEVLVHTDFNFYRARLTTGAGVSVDASFDVEGIGTISGPRETNAVALRITPEGELADKDDFSLLGLHGNIIILFDRELGLPLQVRGEAPRVGAMEINLKAAHMRAPAT
jgi:hypothetical protein